MSPHYADIVLDQRTDRLARHCSQQYLRQFSVIAFDEALTMGRRHEGMGIDIGHFGECGRQCLKSPQAADQCEVQGTVNAAPQTREVPDMEVPPLPPDSAKFKGQIGDF